MKEKLQHIFAALGLFTRLPFWRLWNVPADSYRYAAHHWMIAGGFAAALVAGVATWALPYVPAMLFVLLVFVLNLFLTGAFHEDGLADFFDGFGGGHSRERILEIMKDSHIGTYGVITLILYSLLTCTCCYYWIDALQGTPGMALSFFLIYVMTAVWSRFLASFIMILPYARTAEEAKIKTVYTPWRWRNTLWNVFLAVLAQFAFEMLLPVSIPLIEVWLIMPALTVLVMVWQMNRKIQGYTGDCCGATVLLCELTMNITLVVLLWRGYTL